MIAAYWPESFRRLYGGQWPTSYCCIDLETTGLLFHSDLILEWGHCLVRDTQIVDHLSFLIDWTSCSAIDRTWLSQALDRCNQWLERSGRKKRFSLESMQQQGLPFDQAFPFILDFLQTLLQQKLLLVGHNILFDEKMLCGNITTYRFAEKFSLGDNSFFDTSALEKANQCETQQRMHPKENDTLRSYFHRVKYTRINGCRYDLAEHCFSKYALHTLGAKAESMHTAKEDSFCCHLLMEIWRKQLDGLQSPSSPPPSPTSTTPRRIRGQRNS